MPLVQALTEMLVHGINCLPVLAEEKLVGILTSTDMSTVLEVLLQTARAAARSQQRVFPQPSAWTSWLPSSTDAE